MIHGCLKTICILLVSGEVFYKCWLDPVGWRDCLVLYSSWFSVLLSSTTGLYVAQRCVFILVVLFIFLNFIWFYSHFVQISDSGNTSQELNGIFRRQWSSLSHAYRQCFCFLLYLMDPPWEEMQSRKNKAQVFRSNLRSWVYVTLRKCLTRTRCSPQWFQVQAAPFLRFKARQMGGALCRWHRLCIAHSTPLVPWNLTKRSG